MSKEKSVTWKIVASVLFLIIQGLISWIALGIKDDISDLKTDMKSYYLQQNAIDTRLVRVETRIDDTITLKRDVNTLKERLSRFPQLDGK